jgi:3-oxoacyl-(acyl-carrier-protein) synthase
MAWSNSANKYLAFDSNQNLYSSTDAITWSLQATSSALDLQSFAWINTMVETSDSVLVIGSGLGGIRYTKDFTFTTGFLNSTVPLGVSSLTSVTGVVRSIFDYYLPEGTNEKIKMFGGPNVIAVTP